MQYQINGNQILVGLPTDQYYGVTPSNTNVPNILSTDKLPDAIDKLIGIIDKLAPAKSPGLSTKSLSLVGTFYTARHVGSTTSTSGNVVWQSTSTQSASTASNYNFVFFGTNPVARVADSSAVNSGLATFSDGQTGYLQADIDYSMVVQQSLNSTYYTMASGSVSPDVGTYGNCLNISFDGDPYNVAPNQGFWTSLKAQMTGTQSFVTAPTYDGVEHIYQMSHYTTGTTPIFTFICDNGDATPPSSLNGNPFFTVLTQSSTRWTSGIPSLSVGDWISASYSVSNTVVGSSYPLISRFYNSTQLTRFSMAASQSVNKGDLDSNGLPVIGGTSGVPYAYQPTWNVNGLTVSVTSNMFTDIGSVGYLNGAIFSFTTYNPKNVSTTLASTYTIGGYGAVAGKKVFIDTLSNESTRLRSGQGLYPTQGTSTAQFGESYGNYSTMSIDGTSIVVVGSEMMLYGGQYQYPAQNFTNNWPVAGSNYTSVATTYATQVSTNYYRWVTFNVGSISGQQTCTITLNGSNTTLSTATLNNSTGNYINNFLMYIKVVGASGTNWFDANLDAVAAPTNDGDGCLVKNQSTAISRKISFGTIARTGVVYVRIGFTTTPVYKFSSLTLS